MAYLKKTSTYLHDHLNDNVKVSKWRNTLTTNCYAYALGLDIPEKEIIDGAYSSIGKMGLAYNRTLGSYEKNKMPFVDKLEYDLDFLKIKFKETDPYVLLKDNEWLIAFYSSPKFCDIDFHFVRRDNNRYWTHKPGWKKRPSLYDDNANKIIDLNDAYFEHYKYEKCLLLRK